MKTPFSRLLPLFGICLLLFFTACEKEEIETINETNIPPTTTTITTGAVATRIMTGGIASRTSPDGLPVGCISIDYPFGFEIDDVVYPITSAEDFDSVLTAFVLFTNADDVDFVFPLSITLEDGSSLTVNDDDDLADIVAACVPTTGWSNGNFPAFFFDYPGCIQLSYPVNLEDSDGNGLVANDESEYINLLASNAGIFFTFPLTVVDADGISRSVNDAPALFDVLAPCTNPGGGSGGSSGGGIGVITLDSTNFSFFLGGTCFDYVYPFTVVNTAGAEVVINDENDLSAIIIAGTFRNFKYPFTVIELDDNDREVIEDAQDFVDLISDCIYINIEVDVAYFISLSTFQNCYQLVYPFSYADMSGQVLMVNNAQEASVLLNSGQMTSLVFPVSVIQGGELEVLDTEADFFDLADDCQGSGHTIEMSLFLSSSLLTNCFELVYPFSWSDNTGGMGTITNEQEALTFLNSGNQASLILPVTVIDLDGDLEDIEDLEDLFDLLEDCQPTNPGINLSEFITASLTTNCFELVYPFSYTNANGQQVTITNEQEAIAFLNSGVMGTLILPTTVIEPDGDREDIDEYDDYVDLLLQCNNAGGVPTSILLTLGVFDGSCFTLSYPITITEMNNNLVVINNETEAMAYFNTGAQGLVEFPFSVIETDDGDVEEIEDAQDFGDLLEDCQ